MATPMTVQKPHQQKLKGMNAGELEKTGHERGWRGLLVPGQNAVWASALGWFVCQSRREGGGGVLWLEPPSPETSSQRVEDGPGRPLLS